jgi:hypothetical protein
MGRFDDSIKASLRMRVNKSFKVEDAYHDIKTNLFLAELVWRKQIDEIVELANFEKRERTSREQSDIERFERGLLSDREKRLDTEALERSGWKPE